MGFNILSDSQRDTLWDKISEIYGFENYGYKNIFPNNNIKYRSYSLKSINIMKFSYNADGTASAEYKYNGEKLKNLFASYFDKGMYILDWQHDCYEVDSYEDFPILDGENGGIWKSSFLPEADTVFFLSKDLTEGWITDFDNSSIIAVGENFISQVEKLNFEFLS
ncbi:DUF2716 domain-containing protein [Listeria sp. FSL L7-1582]|uniref:DUF2716 domain-containing protein n=1 Tax=Listeria portnoyi TaxID=2713504 RepID=UPI00164D0F5D|nr:DUF2716 domain-containing protein [Listeria portnoyi]MBC6310882.1 DUF2716 domain-containing protein [Listeria portnoyi]